MSLIDRFKHSVSTKNLFTTNDHLIIAVSGGVDSVVLCELCKQAGYDFSIAHCNFQLRGAESERDEQFVRNLATQHGVTVVVKKFDTEKYAAEHKLSIQEAARNLRYEWFAILSGADRLLATAHHANDSIETLLMNFFRGTGLHGLTGIPASGQGELFRHIRRPLLDFTKEELHSFAKENELSYVEDSSNQSSKYTRNFFRNELIPAISKVYPQVSDNLLDNIHRFQEIESLYQLTVNNLKKKISKQKGKELHIPIRLLLSYNNKALVYELIADYGFTEKQVGEIIKLAKSETGKYISSTDGTHRLIRHRHWFIISPIEGNDFVNRIIEADEKEVRFSLGKLSIQRKSDLKISASEGEALLDAKFIKFPLLLRKAKPGDYFYPLGMRKKKKINRFLIDLKLPKTAKENTWVLESDQRIIWVIGHRIDDRFKISNTTKLGIEIRLTPS